MPSSLKLLIYCDGASRGNPGPAGVGVAVQNEKGQIVQRLYKFIGNATNNQAEYSALILGIEEALKQSAQEVEFFMDSDLVVKQLTGRYQVRSVDLLPFYRQVQELLQGIPRYSIRHVPRALNRVADELANKAIDGHTLL